MADFVRLEDRLLNLGMVRELVPTGRGDGFRVRVVVGDDDQLTVYGPAAVRLAADVLRATGHNLAAIARGEDEADDDGPAAAVRFDGSDYPAADGDSDRADIAG